MALRPHLSVGLLLSSVSIVDYIDPRYAGQWDTSIIGYQSRRLRVDREMTFVTASEEPLD